MFIVLGLALLLVFGMRAFNHLRTMEYARHHTFAFGQTDVTAVRPWMSMRFVASAYAVPEPYLYESLNIDPSHFRDDLPLRFINARQGWGTSPNGDYPAIIDKIQAAILAYQEEPVATGLNRVEPWMSVRYAAHATGIPEDELLAALQLDAALAAVPLDKAARDAKWPGGSKALAAAVQQAIQTLTPQQEQP